METIADRTVIIGAGPAGLTAAWELTRNGRERRRARTGCRHTSAVSRGRSVTRASASTSAVIAFFPRTPRSSKLWSEILGDQMIERDRLSRIYYRGRFFKYPLETLDVLRKLGRRTKPPLACNQLLRCAAAAAVARSVSFEDWVTQRLWPPALRDLLPQLHRKSLGYPVQSKSAPIGRHSGSRTFRCAPCSGSAFSFRKRSNGPVIKTLIDRFPLSGASVRARCGRRSTHNSRERGVDDPDGRTVSRRSSGMRAGIVSVGTTGGPHGRADLSRASSFISTMPIRELIGALDPPAPAEVVAAADAASSIATSSSSRLIVDQRRSVSRPTGFISTSRASKSGASRTSRTGVPRWFPIRATRCSASSISASSHDSMWQMDDAALIALAKRRTCAARPRRSVADR